MRLSKWPTLVVLALAELLGMAVWFSASAVVGALTEAWQLTDDGRAALTMSVQLGFVVGALGSALLNLPDRLSARWLIATAAWLAALATLLIPILDAGLYVTLVLRFMTGAFLAGVYPVGMKVATTWTKADRGLGIGLLVGALTIGSAAPHLLGALRNPAEWQLVVYGAALLATLGGILAAVFLHEGPYRGPSPKFQWRYVLTVLRDRPVVLANLGYLGHMWELYAAWSWLAVFLRASFEKSCVSAFWAGITAFSAIAAGGVGSVAAGLLADRVGRTTITIVSLLTSGSCAISIGFLYGGPPAAVVILALVWGCSIVADSAQFSACISELSHPQYVGTALTLQTSLGFLLTLLTIRLVPSVEAYVGWTWAFSFLAIGPLIGIVAMARLRRLPDAKRIAGGRG